MQRTTIVLLALAWAAPSLAIRLPAQQNGAPRPSAFPANAVEQIAWRHLGPANPMGRMTDIAVHDSRQSTWFVGTAGGGLWRTQNAGTTWQCVFHQHGTVSIGDVAIAPSDPQIVWLGTGEENARNSVQWGDGVYKSTDGGATWTNMGLFETFQIGHIEIHPQNPDIVYVAALGRLWGQNEERGVYRSKDGGASWQRVLYVDQLTSCIDVRVHPTDPDTVFACLYERKRDRFDDNDPIVRFGEYAGLYKSVDGGDNWRQLTNGLPSCTWGRSGLDILATRPDTMFAIIETERSGWQKGDRKDRLETDPPDGDELDQRGGQIPQRPGQQRQGRGSVRGTAVMGIGTEGEDGEGESGAVLTTVTESGPAASSGLQAGDRITKIDDEPVARYADLIEIVNDSRADQKISVTYVREQETSTIELTLGRRNNPLMQAAGRPNGPYSGRLFGQDANKQKYQGDLGHETGGVFRSDDRGETWTRLNSLTERPFYYSVIRVDPRTADNLYCVGTTLWASQDGGQEFKGINNGIHVDFHAIWVDPDDSDHLLAVCDGGINETLDRGKTWQLHMGFSAAQYYDCAVDNGVPYNIVGGLQDNGTWVVPSRTRNREGITLDDCFKIYGGDGFGAQIDPLEPWIVFATSQNGAVGIVDTRSGQTSRIQRSGVPGGGRVSFNWDSPFLLSPHNRLTLYHAGNHVFRGERHSHLDNRASRPDQGPVGNARGMQMRCVSPRLGATEAGTTVAIAESPLVMGLLYVGTDDGALWRSDDGGGNWQRLEQNLPVFEPLYVSDIVPSQFAEDRVYVTLDGHRSDDFQTYVLVSGDRGATWRHLGDQLPGREPCLAIVEDPRNEDLLFLGTEYACWVSFDRGSNWRQLDNGLPTVSVRDLCIQDRDSDLIAATHGRGLFVIDIEGMRQLTQQVAERPAHLCAVEPAWLWRMQSREFQGHKHFCADNPRYGATFHLWLRDVPEHKPVLIVRDVTGEEIAKVEGQAVAGLQPIHWDGSLGRNGLAAAGTYSVRLEGNQDVGVRAFELRPDPGAAANATDPTTTDNTAR